MRTSFSDQLAGLDVGDLAIVKPTLEGLPFPPADAIAQTLSAVWSDLFSLFVDTALEPDVEDLAWGFVNLFHRAANRKSDLLDREADEVRLLLATADGSEVHTHDLEERIDRARAAEESMLALEQLREEAALLYLNETGSSWRPTTSSRLNHGSMLTSALIAGREFVRARAQSKRRAAMPEGSPVVFAGGRMREASDADCKIFANNVWSTLDKVRDQVPDLVLVHGGDSKGLDRLAASWAERHKVPQISFGLDARLGSRAAFRRNEQMLGLDPRYVVAFPGSGVVERLVIDAKAKRITVVDRRGPLGTRPGCPPVAQY